MHNDIKKDYLWNTLGVFTQSAISPLLLIAITRINGISESGMFSFAFSLAIIFWAFGMWGERTYQVSDVQREFSPRSYIMVRILLAVIMLIGATIFVCANNYSTTKSSIIIALVSFKIVESIADAIYGVLQVHNRLSNVGRSLLYKAGAGFGLFVVIDLLTHSILLGCIAITAVNVLFVVFYDIRIAQKLEDIRIRFSQVKHYSRAAMQIIKRCAPVAVMIFLSMFSLNVPRYFIDKYHSSQIGYFGIIAMPITLIALVMSFILQPNMVSLAKMYEKQQYADFSRIVKKILMITAGIGAVILACAYVFGIPALRLVFGVNFSGYKTALLVMVVGGITNALVSVFINIFTIIRHFKTQFYTLVFTNILLGISSATVIKAHGLLAGVYLFAGANVIQLLLLASSYNNVLRKTKV